MGVFRQKKRRCPWNVQLLMFKRKKSPRRTSREPDARRSGATKLQERGDLGSGALKRKGGRGAPERKEREARTYPFPKDGTRRRKIKKGAWLRRNRPHEFGRNINRGRTRTHGVSAPETGVWGKQGSAGETDLSLQTTGVEGTGEERGKKKVG